MGMYGLFRARIKNNLLWGALLCMALLLMQCGGSGGSGNTTTDVAVGGDISAVSISSATGVTIEFSDVTADEEIVFLLYNYSDSSSSQAFQLSSGLSDTSFSLNPLALSLNSNLGDEEDVTGELHELLREAEQDFNEDAFLPNQPQKSSSLKFATIGSTRTFKILNSFTNTSSYETVTAELRVANSDVELYVDTRDENSLSDSELQDLLNDFDGVLDDEERIVGSWSDVNGDGKIAVLFTRVVNELGGSSFVTGFFYAVDLLGEAQYEMSNEMEVFYTFVPNPNGDLDGVTVSKDFSLTNIYPGVLSHELQHMISFNQHYFINGGASEEGWLNEGLAHLLEDIYNLNSDDYMTASGLENPARVATFLANTENICFTCGTSLSQRGGSYLFLRYLYEQAEQGNLASYGGGITGGTELIQALLDTSDRGMDNLATVIFGSSWSTEDAQTLLGNFSLAVYLSNTGLQSSTVYNFDGIDLRATQNDNRGTVLNGPSVVELDSLTITDTLPATGMIYMQFDGSLVINAGGSLQLDLSNANETGGYIIR